MSNAKLNDTVALTPRTPADEYMPTEIDFTQARRGDFLPSDPAERAERLQRRVIALQAAGGQLRDKLDRVLVLLAREAGQLDEAEAAARLGVDRRMLGDYRAAALAEALAGNG